MALFGHVAALSWVSIVPDVSISTVPMILRPGPLAQR